jgi:hypothetical protein
MKKLLAVVLVSCVACAGQSGSDTVQANDRTALTYEGRIELNQDESLYMIVSLYPSREPGEGEYILNETLEAVDGVRQLSSLHGKYSKSATEDGRLITHLHQSALMEKVKRSFINPVDGKYYEENFRSTDVNVIQTDDLSFLRVVNLNSKKMSAEAQPELTRRTSKPFTVEGYFTHMGDSSRFEEINTEQQWPVSKLGVYMQALRHYHQLAEKKYERIYLKGVGYSVVHFNKKGEEGEALVFQKIIQMTSSPTVN